MYEIQKKSFYLSFSLKKEKKKSEQLFFTKEITAKKFYKEITAKKFYLENSKSIFKPIRKFFRKCAKFQKNHFRCTLSVPSFRKIREPFCLTKIL